MTIFFPYLTAVDDEGVVSVTDEIILTGVGAEAVVTVVGMVGRTMVWGGVSLGGCIRMGPVVAGEVTAGIKKLAVVLGEVTRACCGCCGCWGGAICWRPAVGEAWKWCRILDDMRPPAGEATAGGADVIDDAADARVAVVDLADFEGEVRADDSNGELCGREGI